jgi:hypothetical protein
MSRIRLVSLALLLTALFAGSVAAQRKPAPRKTTPAKTTPAKTTIVPPLEVRTARDKVDAQRSNVNLFVDRLGPIAQAIETLDTSAKTKTLPKVTLDVNEENKQKVIGAIRNLRQGLTDLESEFRTKPTLQKYLTSIQGITDLAAQAEDDAIAGRFVGSKDPLRQISQKLTDTLAVMPR